MSNWRNSNFFIVASSCVTGFVAAAAITFTYIIPLYQKQDSNTISELNTKISVLNRTHKKEIDSLNNTIDTQRKKFEDLQYSNTKLTTENNGYKSRLLSLSTLSTFQHGQPLPIGYSSILPGMKLSDVTKKYNKDMLHIDSQGEFITVKVETAGIEDIIYSTGVDETPGVITSILVSKYDLEILVDGKRVNDKNTEQSLLNILQENLGQTEECSAGEYVWSMDNYRYVYFNSKRPYFYQIFFGGIYAPGTSSKCLKLINALFSKDK